MIRPNTVLLLGAGASEPYGFPLGWELREEIVRLCANPPDDVIGIDFTRVDFQHFSTAFQRSQMFSIDAFLARRAEFADIGKIAIAHILLARERHWSDCEFSVVPRAGGRASGDFYKYLWNRIATDEWKELNLSTLKIVTFNYDRSLEAYLVHAMRYAYAVSEELAFKKLEKLEIVHVYGSLGSINKRSADSLPFGPDRVSPRLLTDAAQRLSVIPEARDEDATILKARDILYDADYLAILGFGFDELNLKRLEAHRTLANPRTVSGGQRYRGMAASCFGLTRMQATSIATYCGHSPANSSGLPAGFVDGDCRRTLEETLILGEWA